MYVRFEETTKMTRKTCRQTKRKHIFNYNNIGELHISRLPLQFTAIKYIVDKLKHYNGELCRLRIIYAPLLQLLFDITVVFLVAASEYLCVFLVLFSYQYFLLSFGSIIVVIIFLSGWAHCYFWIFQINGIRIYFFKC